MIPIRSNATLNWQRLTNRSERTRWIQAFLSEFQLSRLPIQGDVTKSPSLSSSLHFQTSTSNKFVVATRPFVQTFLGFSEFISRLPVLAVDMLRLLVRPILHALGFPHSFSRSARTGCGRMNIQSGSVQTYWISFVHSLCEGECYGN